MKKLKHIFLLLSVFSITPLYALTQGQITTEIRLRVKDTNSSRQRYSDAQLLNLENEAQRDIINNTLSLHKSTTVALVLNTTYYTLPSDVMTLERITLDYVLLPETTLIKLDGDNGGGSWETTSGRPQDYFVDPTNPSLIGMYPWPSTTTALGTLRIFYYANAADLALTSDVPFNGISSFSAFHDLLIFYSAYRIYLIEGEDTKAATYRQEYESRLQIMNSVVGAKPNFNPSFAGPKTSR